MKRIQFKLSRVGIVGAIAALSLTTPAFAGTAEDVDTCKAELANHVEALGGSASDASSFQFKRISGGGVKTITFSAKLSGESQRVKCKIRREKVVDILNAEGESVFEAEAS